MSRAANHEARRHSVRKSPLLAMATATPTMHHLRWNRKRAKRRLERSPPGGLPCWVCPGAHLHAPLTLMLRGFTAHTRRSLSLQSARTELSLLIRFSLFHFGLVLAGPQRYLRSQHPLSWSTVCTAPLTAWNLDSRASAHCGNCGNLNQSSDNRSTQRLRYCRCEARLPAHACCCVCGSATRSLLPYLLY